MTAELEVWRAARELIQKHGKKAEMIAAQSLDDCLVNGDSRGKDVWVAVIDAIKVLQK